MAWTPRRTITGPDGAVPWIPFSRYYVKCPDCHKSGQRVSNTNDWKAWHVRWHEANGVDPVLGRLPFAMPDTATLRSNRQVGAVYYPAMPISLDNVNPGLINWGSQQFGADYWGKNYVHPDGEGGAHKSYGGWARDRPEPYPAQTGDWRGFFAKVDVANAVKAGLDYFKLNVMTLPGQHPWQHEQCRALMNAADAAGFKVMLMLDMTAGGITANPTATAAFFAELAGHPSARRVNGKLALSAFTAERVAPSWFTSLFTTLKNAHGLEVEFYPMFQNTDAHAGTFAPISAGWNDWGDRNPAWNATSSTGDRRRRIAYAKSLGKAGLATVSCQGARPREDIYDEAENTTNLRNTWQIAIAGDADGVEIGVWNDYTEGDVFAPSVMHGWTFLDINAYYLTRYKMRAEPVIEADAVYLSHRRQFHDAHPTYPQTRLMRLRGGSLPRDTAEALVFLPAPATVEVRAGGQMRTYDLGPGVHAVTCPLGLGYVSAKVIRGGVVKEIRSPHEVKAPYVQDLQYVAAGGVL